MKNTNQIFDEHIRSLGHTFKLTTDEINLRRIWFERGVAAAKGNVQVNINVDTAEVQRAIDAAIEACTDGRTVYAGAENLAEIDGGCNLITLSAAPVGLYQVKCVLVVLP